MAPPAPTRALTDGGAVAMCIATWVATAFARPLPLVVGAGLIIASFMVRRPWLLVVGVVALGSALASAAWAGLVPVAAGRYEGSVLFVRDPEELNGAWRAEVKLDDGRRVELWARGPAGSAVRDVLAGQRLDVAGALEPPSPDASWLAVRHVVGRLTVEAVRGAPVTNDLFAGLANGYRSWLVTGSYALPREQRPLYLGFVLGDDRGQDPAVVDDFRGSGLSHLLVVSGQNVAFLLVLARPFIRRLPMAGRLAATVGVLLWFATLTRFEPSVLRATAMAAVAALAVFRGTRVAPIRVLALAVTALLLVDPFLHASTGFQLSVGASAGIVLLARRIADAVPGPRVIAESLGVTLAAQAGVAPVLVTTFGGLPVASIAANLLAVPAAGPVMMWGLTGGAAAGLLGAAGGGAVSRALHWPTSLLLAWVGGVARVAASAPLGQLGLVAVVVVAASVAGAVWATGRRPHLARFATAVAVVALLLPAVALRSPRPGVEQLAAGATLWRSADAAVLQLTRADASAADVLEGLRERGVSGLDLIVSASGSRTASTTVDALTSRLRVAAIWQPVNGSLTDATTPVAGDAVALGAIDVEVVGVDPKLVVEIRDRSAPAAHVEGSANTWPGKTRSALPGTANVARLASIRRWR